MAWVLDVIFFVILLLGCLIGSKVGFVNGVCKIAGWILSLIVPFVFCAAFKDALEGWFGMVTAITNGIGNATLAGWISMAVSFILLFIIVRLSTWLLGKVGTALTETVKPIAFVNKLLGGLLGILEAFLLCYFLLLVCSWLNIESVVSYIEQSTVVRAIFESDLMGYLPK